MSHRTQVVLTGGGQAGPAAGYHLRRPGPGFVILDAQTTPGGAWQHAWDSLRLSSPAAYSSPTHATCTATRSPATRGPYTERQIVGDGGLFALTVSGDSMIDAAIRDGDIGQRGQGAVDL